MLKIIASLNFIILFLICHFSEAQKYKSLYDVLQEELSLGKDTFEFELIDPLDPNKLVSGNYLNVGDTLIFNQGKKQNKIVVKKCVCEFNTSGEDNKLIFLNEEGEPITYFEAYINEKSVRASMKGLITIDGEFPKEIKISILPLSDSLWANPYQKVYFETKLKCSNDSINNLMIVQLDLSDEFKKPFEFEKRLLKKGDTLFHLRNGIEKIDYPFYILDTTKEVKEERRTEQLTPQNAFSGRELYDFSNYFNHALIDSFLVKFEEKDAAFFYEVTDKNFKKDVNTNNFKRYFDLIQEFYGEIKIIDSAKYTMRISPFDSKNMPSSVYRIVFPDYEGYLEINFSIVDRNTINLVGMDLSLTDYTEVKKINNISEEVFRILRNKNSKELYEITSNRFKEYTSINVLEIC